MKIRKLRVWVLVVLVGAGVYTTYQFIDNSSEVTAMKEDKNEMTSNDEVYEKLKEMAVYNEKIAQVVAAYSSYPKEITKLLAKSPESVDFVLDYFKNHDQIHDTIEDINFNEVPKLYQWDTRWGFAMYGDQYLGISGCAPTVLSMAAIYLLQDASYTPYYMAQLADQNGYYVPGEGTAWSLMNEIGSYINLNTSEISLDKEMIRNVLNAGGLVICSMKPGDFTTSGHFILIVGIAENGDYIVRDPNNVGNTIKKWSYERLQGQINNLWSIQGYYKY